MQSGILNKGAAIISQRIAIKRVQPPRIGAFFGAVAAAQLMAQALYIGQFQRAVNLTVRGENLLNQG